MVTIRKTFVLAWLMALIVLSSRVDGQTDQKAVLVEQIGPISSEQMRASFDVFLAELARKPGSKGLVYSHGTEMQIRDRTLYFQEQLRFRGFDTTRITFVSGRNVGSVRTDFWIIPAGAAPPDIESEAWIAAQFGRVYRKDAVKKIEAYFQELWKLDDHQGYIINYGTPEQIALRERWIRDGLTVRYGHHWPRITLVNGGPGPQRTVMWLVPPGAENPTL